MGASKLALRPYKPGSDVNPINPRSNGVTPVALLSTTTLDATQIDPGVVRLGPGAAKPKETTIKAEDVNGDGRLDQVLHFVTKDLKLSPSSTQVCASGLLVDGETFSKYDRVRPK
ncbi:MAG: hypothetical protein WKF73_12335 [Nocardioidaceae bacterium]